MRTTYCHVEKGDCEVKDRQLKDNQAEKKTDRCTEGEKPEHLMHIHSNIPPNKSFQGQ